MSSGHQLKVPHNWSTLEQLPWPEPDSFEVAKAEIENRAKELWNLPKLSSRVRRDKYATEFVSNNKHWIPEDRQAWTKGCILKLMSRTKYQMSCDSRAGQDTSSASQGIQDSGTAIGASDDNQLTPSPVLQNNGHGDNNHGHSNEEDSNYEDNNQTNNETTLTTDNVPRHKRSTRAISLDLDDDVPQIEASKVDDKFSPSALKQYNIRINRFVNGNLRTTKRVLLWLCGSEAPIRSSLFDIGHLIFDRLARLANLSENEILTYAYARSPTGYMQITDDADFITAIQYLINQNASPVDDLV
ncbi:hypothetical protein KCU67_g11185, partial [Aureobasidium melanogenum]